jgi:hypothetical protein
MIYTVTCHVPDNSDADRRMQGIGGPGWYKTVDEVLRCLAERDTFNVTVNYRTVRVIPGKHNHTSRPYITTEGDGFPPNNLLNLPRCPGR